MSRFRRPTRRRVMAAAFAVAVTGAGLTTLGPGTGNPKSGAVADGTISPLPKAGKSFAGQSDDPFFVDPSPLFKECPA